MFDLGQGGLAPDGAGFAPTMNGMHPGAAAQNGQFPMQPQFGMPPQKPDFASMMALIAGGPAQSSGAILASQLAGGGAAQGQVPDQQAMMQFLAAQAASMAGQPQAAAAPPPAMMAPAAPPAAFPGPPGAPDGFASASAAPPQNQQPGRGPSPVRARSPPRNRSPSRKQSPPRRRSPSRKRSVQRGGGGRSRSRGRRSPPRRGGRSRSRSRGRGKRSPSRKRRSPSRRPTRRSPSGRPQRRSPSGRRSPPGRKRSASRPAEGAGAPGAPAAEQGDKPWVPPVDGAGFVVPPAPSDPAPPPPAEPQGPEGLEELERRLLAQLDAPPAPPQQDSAGGAQKSPQKRDRSKSRSRSGRRRSPSRKRRSPSRRRRSPSRRRSRGRRSPSRRRRSPSRRRNKSRRRSPSRRRRSPSRRRSRGRRSNSRGKGGGKGYGGGKDGGYGGKDGGYGGKDGGYGGGKDGGKGKGKQEDWTCPNASCGASVFGSKDECFKCHTKKDGSKGAGGGAAPGAELCGDFKRGNCSRGESCRFSHAADAGGESGGWKDWNSGGDSGGWKDWKSGGESSGWKDSGDTGGWKDWSGGGGGGAKEMCGDFKRGNCTRGDGCRFSHEESAGGDDGKGKGKDGKGKDGKGKKGKGEDWDCPKCGISVFASKSECFKCHTKKDGTKGDGKGDGPAAPQKFSETQWEQPRAETGLQLIREMVQQPTVANWEYMLNDENRRSFAAFLSSPFTSEQTKMFFDTMKECVKWDQPEGPNGPIPRQTAWMVAPGGCCCKYRYGRIEVEPQVYPPAMLQIMSLIMPLAGLPDMAQWPNSCNLNLYTDGGMSVGWHSDDEQIFQGKFQDIRIISFSLGAKRKFELRANWPEKGERPVNTIMLGDGDLCTMEGMMQKHFQHRVPKEGHVEGARINMTWRWVAKHTPQCPVKRTR